MFWLLCYFPLGRSVPEWSLLSLWLDPTFPSSQVWWQDPVVRPVCPGFWGDGIRTQEQIFIGQWPFSVPKPCSSNLWIQPNYNPSWPLWFCTKNQSVLSYCKTILVNLLIDNSGTFSCMSMGIRDSHFVPHTRQFPLVSALQPILCREYRMTCCFL